jgi:hypothetical protein
MQRTALSLVLPVFGGMFLLFACAAAPREAPIPISPPLPVEEKPVFHIIDYKDKDSGQNIPDWAARFIDEGLPGVEALPRFEGRYVFIDINSGTNFNALSQWSSGFSIPQDFPRIVSARVLARFTGIHSGSPDQEYGYYFESTVKAAADMGYSEARREEDFWLLKRTLPEDAADAGREIYDFYILVTIEKNLFTPQLDRVLLRATEDLNLSRDQLAAANRLRETFYDGF